jgi:hypothetical protein
VATNRASLAGLEHQLVLQFDLAAPDDFDAILAVEEQLTSALDDADVEGHTVGTELMHVFIRCDDADDTFASVRDIVETELLDEARAGWRVADDDAFTPLWPPGLDRFDVS